MKHNVYKALTTLAVALLISVPMSQAQDRLQASVPFAFSMNSDYMPDGSYEISPAGGSALVVRNLDTKKSCFLIASMHVEASQASGTPHAKLVFHKYGDQYFLVEIWSGQSNTGIALPESKREKELQIANNLDHQPELVVVAMK
jgi:hypothetical protein